MSLIYRHIYIRIVLIFYYTCINVTSSSWGREDKTLNFENRLQGQYICYHWFCIEAWSPSRVLTSYERTISTSNYCSKTDRYQMTNWSIYILNTRHIHIDVKFLTWTAKYMFHYLWDMLLANNKKNHIRQNKIFSWIFCSFTSKMEEGKSYLYNFRIRWFELKFWYSGVSKLKRFSSMRHRWIICRSKTMFNITCFKAYFLTANITMASMY